MVAAGAVVVFSLAHAGDGFGGEDDVVALTVFLERPADELLRDAAAIAIGGVNEVDARVESFVNHLVRGRLVGDAAEIHGAETEL